MSFQDNLRKERVKAGFTSAKLFAEHINVPYNTYLGYETKNVEPRYDTLVKISKALQVSTDKLLGITDVSIDWLENDLKKYMLKTKYFLWNCTETDLIIGCQYVKTIDTGEQVISEGKQSFKVNEIEKLFFTILRDCNDKRDENITSQLDRYFDKHIKQTTKKLNLQHRF